MNSVSWYNQQPEIGNNYVFVDCERTPGLYVSVHGNKTAHTLSIFIILFFHEGRGIRFSISYIDKTPEPRDAYKHGVYF
jgi:hypothetical protein